MDPFAKITRALQIAVAAQAFAQAVRQRQQAKFALETAYNAWKHENGIGYVERHSHEWEAMLAETAGEYLALERAKRRERYYRDKLVALADREVLP